ncbi:MAG: ABC transporter ATP-binding protein [Actinobacteria bacterium]|nr:ABC transporter ATP-binding protein [Actinomycetota bacterium]
MVGAIVSGLSAQLHVERPSGFVLDIALEAEAGTTVALLGPNGAGKSTALWALAGVIALAGGGISLDGRVLDDPASGVFVPPEDRRIGALFQDVLLFPHLDVAGNVAFALRARASSQRAADREAHEWLDRFELSDLAAMRPAELSGGQAQRVGLARALAAGPDLLLLDEPLSALDVGSRARVRRMLAEHLSGFAGPRILITHDPAEAALLADRVVVVEAGTVTQTGTPEQILRAPRTAYTADLAGLNLLTGAAGGGMIDVGAGPGLQVADRSVAGEVLVTIHPRAVSIHPSRPTGSARNTWPSTITSIETLGNLCRVQFEHPIPLTAEITVEAQRSLGLEPGTRVWVAIKATEIEVLPG